MRCTVIVRSRFGLALALAALVVPLNFARAQDGKPMRLIVHTTAGSNVDVVARRTSQDLSQRTHQPWVVDNRPGANGVIGADACAKSPPDGSTVCMLSLEVMSFNPHLLAKLSYDPDRDFRPVINLFNLYSGLIVSPSLGVNSVHELQGLAVAKRGALNFGTLGAGSYADIFRQWVADRWKTDIVGIPYKGGNLIVNAVMAGEIQLAMSSPGNVYGQLKSGKAKIIAVGSSRRARLLPETQTLAEAGLGDFPSIVWWGLFAPAGTSDAVVSRLNAEVTRLYRETAFVEFLEGQFFEPLLGSPESFAAFIKADRERIGQVVKKFNIPNQ